MRQLSMLPRLEPEDVLELAAEQGPFVGRFCLVSGGRDSTVTAHRARAGYEELAFIDTGTAIPGVRAFVEELAALLEKPLRILETPRDEYARIVLGSDRSRSNGPAGHRARLPRTSNPRDLLQPAERASARDAHSRREAGLSTIGADPAADRAAEVGVAA